MSKAELEKRISSAKYDLDAALEMIKEDDTDEALAFLEYAEATISQTVNQLKCPTKQKPTHLRSP